MHAWLRTGWVWGPAVAALAVRLALVAAGGLLGLEPGALRYDAIEYHALGASLAAGDGFQMDGALAARNALYDPALLRTPGYPALVAAVYAVVGPLPGAVLVLQIGLDALACALLAVCLRPALGRVGAGTAGLVVALHPASALYAGMLLSETALVAVLVAAYFATLQVRAGRWRWALGAGVLWGLAALVKPVALWMPVLAAAAVVWTARRAGTRALRPAAWLLTGCAVVVAPWVAWNGAVRGVPMVSTSSAYNALALYAAPVVAASEGLAPGPALVAVQARAERRALDAGVRPRSDLDRVPFWKAETAATFRRHPLVLVRLQLQGMARSFVSVGRGSRHHLFGETPARARAPGARGALRWWLGEPLRDRVLDAWALGYFALVYPVLGLGAWGALRRRREPALWLAAVLAAYLLTVTGVPGHSRFMVPAVPFWAPFVGVAVAQAWRRRRPEAAGPGRPNGGISRRLHSARPAAP